MLCYVMANQYINDFNETVKAYYDDLGKYKPLSRREERRLLRQTKKGSLKAKNKILEHNLRFVFEIAKRYSGRGVAMGDLISEGNMGLLKAIEKFDESRDVKFISYAVWWIRQSMLEAIKKTKLINTVEIEPNSSNDEIISRKVSDDEDESVTYYDVGFSNEMDERKKEVIENQKQVISELMETLNDREKIIIESFYGLNGKKEMTLTEISKMFGISIERARQVKKQGMKKLRSEALLLEESDEFFT